MQKSEFPKMRHYVGFWQIGSQYKDGWRATKLHTKATATLKIDKWYPLVPFSPPHTIQSNSYIHGQIHQPSVW